MPVQCGLFCFIARHTPYNQQAFDFSNDNKKNPD